jgi:hypothetical protein
MKNHTTLLPTQPTPPAQPRQYTQPTPPTHNMREELGVIPPRPIIYFDEELQESDLIVKEDIEEVEEYEMELTIAENETTVQETVPPPTVQRSYWSTVL